MGDLKLLRSRYRRVATIAGKGDDRGQFKSSLKGLAIDGEDQLLAAGDRRIKVFAFSAARECKLVREWATASPALSVAVAADGRVFVGQAGLVEIFDEKGKRLEAWRDAKRLSHVSTVGFVGDDVLLGDVKGRCIRRFDSKGKFLNDIGTDNRMRGFLVPNGHVDFAVDSKGVIHATNPGKHRIERYDVKGKMLSRFGRFGGADPAGFSGCCNPTNITLLSDDRLVVTEKAGPRAKVYAEDDALQALVGEEDFDAACKNMDVARDSDDRLYVVDTVRLNIRVYEAVKTSAVRQPTSAPADSLPASAPASVGEEQ